MTGVWWVDVLLDIAAASVVAWFGLLLGLVMVRAHRDAAML
jgi:hypothetical protein